MRLIELLGLIFSPRRGAAYRLLEAELQRARAVIEAREEKIEQLYSYILFQAKQAPLEAVRPKPIKPEAPRPPQIRPSITDKEAEYQARFRREYEEKQRREQQSGLPNDFSLNDPFSDQVQ